MAVKYDPRIRSGGDKLSITRRKGMVRAAVCAKGVLPVNLRLDEKLVVAEWMRRMEAELAGTIYAKLQENCKTAFALAFVAAARGVYRSTRPRFGPHNRAIIFRRFFKSYL